jgi:thioredoxin:protein disulfide reductase
MAWSVLGLTSDRGRAMRPSFLSISSVFFVLLLLTLASASVLPAPASASNEDQGDMPTEVQVPVRVVLANSGITPGGETFLAVIYDVPRDAHIQLNEFFYAQPAEGEPFVLGPPVKPVPATFEGDSVYQGRTTVFVRARFSRDLSPGRRTIKVAAGYQACVEKPSFACFAPVDQVLDVPLEIVAAGSPTPKANQTVFAAMAREPLPPSAPPAGGETAADRTIPEGGATQASVTGAVEPSAQPVASEGGLAGKLQEALARRSFLAFLIVFLGGLATSFTPCVYPMIPITISYIGGRSKGKLGGFFLSIFFVLGIAVTYSTLGVVAASTGALFGSAMQSTPVLIVVSLVFFSMGSSMLGAFDLALPSGLQTKLQTGPRAGILGAFFMGIVTGLVASPCVGPVVVVLLTWVAKIGSIGLGFLLLFTFALGLGMLFLVIGTFAGALNALPQAGGWMDTVKHVFGVILLGMGIFYIRSLIGPNLTWIVSGVFVLLVGTCLGAFRPIGTDEPKSILLRKGFGIVLLLVGAFALLVGLARYTKIPLGGGATMVASGSAGPVAHEGLAWLPDDVTGLQQAKALGKPAVMDFYADWCAACKELDEKTWSVPDVRQEGARFVAVKMDMTERSQRNKAKQDQYRVPGLPTVIFFDSGGNEVKRFFGFKSAPEVLAIMREVR